MPSVLRAVAVCTLVVAMAAGASRADDKKSRVMTADAMKKKGLKMEKTLDLDLDGDGRKELVVLGSGEKGLQLALVGENEAGAVVTLVAPPALGQKLVTLEAKALVPPANSQQVVLEILDDTPDEKVKRVRVYHGLKLDDVFSSKIERAKNADDRPEWDKDKSIIQYGEPRAGWYFEDREGDKVFEAYVRRKPQLLAIPKDDGDPVKIITGVREQKWAWDDKAGRYADSGEQLNDFIPSLTIAKVEASDAWVEPKELKDLKAKALSDALMQATAKEGPVDAGPPAKGAKPVKEVQDDVQVDLSPYMKLAADQKLDTAWIENDPKGDGKDQWVEVTLDEASTVHMVRLVLGCVKDKNDFKAHNVPESFKIRLDNGSDALINRRDPGKFDGQVVAFSDSLVKLADRPFAKTTLIFFDGKSEASKVRITLDKAIKQGKGNQTCISEISVH